MDAQNKDIDELNYYRINNGRRHEAQGRHFHLEKKSHLKRCEISIKEQILLIVTYSTQ